MSRPPLFSVVIPTYNRKDLVIRAIHSTLNQTLREFEVIIVDDGSTDGTCDAVRRLSDPRVRYVAVPHRGPSSARNVGAAVAHGRYLTFLDSDDLAAPTWLETLAAGFDDPTIEVVRCGWITIGRDGMVKEVGFPAPVRNPMNTDVWRFLAGTYAVRLDVFRELGGFNESLRFGEHTELAIRMVRRWHSNAAPIQTSPRLLIRRLPSGHSYGAAQAEMARFVLEHHGEYLRQHREVRSLYHRIAGVHAAKSEDLRTARRHLLCAVLNRPWSLTDWGRTAVATLPPLARRVWHVDGARAANHIQISPSPPPASVLDGGREDAWHASGRPQPQFVSVVLPARNGAATIGEQLEALARQDFAGRWELVVVDNGSADGTARSSSDTPRGFRACASFEHPGSPPPATPGTWECASLVATSWPFAMLMMWWIKAGSARWSGPRPTGISWRALWTRTS